VASVEAGLVGAGEAVDSLAEAAAVLGVAETLVAPQGSQAVTAVTQVVTAASASATVAMAAVAWAWEASRVAREGGMARTVSSLSQGRTRTPGLRARQ
tara:strand:+ start:4011 stop:4304 length:294 start_codon:yes stop_codon:yes gene_type:complete